MTAPKYLRLIIRVLTLPHYLLNDRVQSSLCLPITEIKSCELSH